MRKLSIIVFIILFYWTSGMCGTLITPSQETLGTNFIETWTAALVGRDDLANNITHYTSILDASTQNVTYFLPDDPANEPVQRIFYFVCIDTSDPFDANCVINASGGLIDGAATKTLSDGDKIIVQYDGTQYRTIMNN